MKITATRVDDIRKAREEYDADMNKYDAAAEKSLQRLHFAEKEEKDKLEKIISDLIGPSTLQLEIHVDTYGKGLFDDNWSVRVRANEDTKFDDKVALAWNWDVSLNRDGEVVKDSGSWSGLKAITPEQVADLEESVRIIKLLNGLDWPAILRHPKPKFDDYYDKESANIYYDKRNARPNFEDQIVTARLEELIDQNTAIKLTDDQYYRGPVGMLVTGLTDKFVKGYIFPWSYTSSKTADELRNYAGEVRRASRDKIVKHNGEIEELNLL